MALFLLLPDLPSGEGLEEQHLESVLYGGAPFLALFHEERLIGIVEQVVEHVVGRQLLVRDVRAGVDVGEHAQRGGVDDHGVLRHDLRGDLLVGDATLLMASGDESGADPQLLQPLVDRFGGTARTEDERLLVGGFQQRLDGLLEADDVGVVTDELGLAKQSLGELDDVDCPDLAGVGVEIVEVGNNLFLIGDRDVQTAQIRVLSQDVLDLLDVGDLEIDVFRVDFLGLEFLVEIGFREGMAEWIA